MKDLFDKFKEYGNLFHLSINELTSSREKFNFPCFIHRDKAVNIIAFIVQLYLETRMKEFVKQQKIAIQRQNVLRKKAARLCSA